MKACRAQAALRGQEKWRWRRSPWLVGSNMDAYIGAHQVREREGVDSNRFNWERYCASPISCQLNSTKQIEELELRDVTASEEREDRSRMKVKISHTVATILSKIIPSKNFYTQFCLYLILATYRWTAEEFSNRAPHFQSSCAILPSLTRCPVCLSQLAVRLSGAHSGPVCILLIVDFIFSL